MDTLIIYFRTADIYNKDLGKAAIIDSFLVEKLGAGFIIEPHVFTSDKNAYLDSKSIHIMSNCRNILLIGTIPYQSLITNLYALEAQGYSIWLFPELIITENPSPVYPEEFVKSWKADLTVLNELNN